MPVFVNLSTSLRNYVQNYQPALGLSIAIENDLSLMELAEKIGLPPDEIKIIMLNGRRSEPEEIATDGDRVAFFPAVGGG